MAQTVALLVTALGLQLTIDTVMTHCEAALLDGYGPVSYTHLGTSGGNGIDFTNNGTVNGSLFFAKGDDNLTFMPGSNVTGNIDGGGGKNTLNLDGGNDKVCLLYTSRCV